MLISVRVSSWRLVRRKWCGVALHALHVLSGLINFVLKNEGGSDFLQASDPTQVFWIDPRGALRV